MAADRLPDPSDEIHADPPHEVWKAAREREGRCACDPCWFAFIARQPDPNHAAKGWSNAPAQAPISAAVSPADTIRRTLERWVVTPNPDELADALAAVDEWVAVGERDKAELDAIRDDVEQMIREGCTEPSPEAAAYLALLRERHVAQIKALEKKLAKRVRDGRRIAQLTEALERICTLGLFDKGNGLVEAQRIARAVLADEEDANG